MGIEDIKKWRNVEELLMALKHKDRDIREAAAVALERMNWKPKNDMEKTRYLVAKGDFKELIKVGEPVVEPLIQFLYDKDWKIRLAAAETLGEIGDARAVVPLIQAMKREIRRFQSWAEVGVPKTFTQPLKDESRSVQEAIAVSLGRITDVRAVEPLIKALKDEYSLVRWGAAEALSNIGDARAVEPLIQAIMKDESGLVREAATKALGNIRNRGKFFEGKAP